MIDQAHVEALYDCDVIDNHGEKIGSVKQVWLEDGTGAPLWAEVHTGLFGTRQSFVPIQEGQVAGGAITVPVSKQQVKDAPSAHTSADHMSDEEQEALYRHYGMIPQAKTGEHDRLGGRRGGRDAAEVTLSEEKLDVGTRNVEAGRVRLVKHTVTEQRNITVPVTHEEARVVREPAKGKPGRAFADEQAEVTLHREEPVVQKRTEAVERVRLEKDAVTEQRDVKGEVRKERAEVEREGERRDRR
ncbi:conserved domain-containing protein [Lentzea albidocapillata subsp. violacea]|uniref:Conserved domain-containing protein n=1 Tax=Lentzea albidocapillata subsp. violacea TaxID=128104 RepID=A0A1G9THK6_9PSEU|nr:PRC and DUF2382 domain-containing protein [Lentzea albidocapillata]SDM47246.1 conserved domain-containing protein [Lentzea albidocapillata subsp. violacea]